MEKIINTYIKQNNYKSGDIIFNFTRNGLSQILLNTSAKYLGGIKLSTTMIRKSYLSSKYSDIKKEQDKDATIMKHSVETGRPKGAYLNKQQIKFILKIKTTL